MHIQVLPVICALILKAYTASLVSVEAPVPIAKPIFLQNIDIYSYEELVGLLSEPYKFMLFYPYRDYKPEIINSIQSDVLTMHSSAANSEVTSDSVYRGIIKKLQYARSLVPPSIRGDYIKALKSEDYVKTFYTLKSCVHASLVDNFLAAVSDTKFSDLPMKFIYNSELDRFEIFDESIEYDFGIIPDFLLDGYQLMELTPYDDMRMLKYLIDSLRYKVAFNGVDEFLVSKLLKTYEMLQENPCINNITTTKYILSFMASEILTNGDLTLVVRSALDIMEQNMLKTNIADFDHVPFMVALFGFSIFIAY